MKLGIVGASNIAISVEKDNSGGIIRSFEENLVTVMQELCNAEIEKGIGFTVARINDKDDCYIDCVKRLSGGDVLFLQGEGNDYGMRVVLGEQCSVNENEYYGALNTIANIALEKFERVIFSTGFCVSDGREYKKYNDAIRHVAENNGFELIDFYNDSDFVPGENLPDREHMNPSALRLYAEKLFYCINGQKVHCMNLNDAPFKAIVSGKKRIELRLFDKKREKVKIGDKILFDCNGETLSVRVLRINRANSFEELFERQNTPEIYGFEKNMTPKAMAEEMRQYYTKEDENKYGVVGIEFDKNGVKKQ